MFKNVWYIRTTSLFFAATLLGLASGDTNYTVDDFERDRINYLPSGSWRAVSDDATLDRFRQTTTYTRDQGAFATFRFQGSAIYFGGYGELVVPPDTPGQIRVQLDNEIHDVSANINPAKPAQQILFSQTGLDPTIQHVITVQKTSETGKRDLNVDFFVYTVPAGLNDTKIPVPDSIEAVETQAGGLPTGALIGVIMGGALGGMLLVVLAFWFLNRRKRIRNREYGVLFDTDVTSVSANTAYIPSPYIFTNAQYYPPEPSTSRSTESGHYSSRPPLPTATDGVVRPGHSREPSSSGDGAPSNNHGISVTDDVPPPGYTDQQILTPPSSSSLTTGLITSPWPSPGRNTKSPGPVAAPVNPAAIPMRKLRLDRSAGQETRRQDRM